MTQSPLIFFGPDFWRGWNAAERRALAAAGNGPLVLAPTDDAVAAGLPDFEDHNDSWATESSRDVEDFSVSSLGDSLRSWTDAAGQFGTPARWSWDSRRFRREAAVAAGDVAARGGMITAPIAGGCTSIVQAADTLPAADIEGHDQEEDGAPPPPKLHH